MTNMSSTWTLSHVWDGFPRDAAGILNASFPNTEAAWSPILPCLGFFACIFFVSVIISGPILRVNRKYLPTLGACSMSLYVLCLFQHDVLQWTALKYPVWKLSSRSGVRYDSGILSIDFYSLMAIGGNEEFESQAFLIQLLIQSSF